MLVKKQKRKKKREKKKKDACVVGLEPEDGRVPFLRPAGKRE